MQAGALTHAPCAAWRDVPRNSRRIQRPRTMGQRLHGERSLLDPWASVVGQVRIAW